MEGNSLKLCIIGAFGFDRLQQTTGGQPVKTRQIYYTLSNHFGEENVSFIETYGWKSAPYKMVKDVLKAAKTHDAIIMLPAHRGVQIFARLLLYCKKKYGIKIFYDVIGGWLPEKTGKDKRLKKLLLQFNGVWVETKSMKDALNQQGFSNVTVVPNFRRMQILTQEQRSNEFGYPLKMCTFSRVMREKGIEVAVDSVQWVNNCLGYPAIALDIYGPIDPVDADWFELIKAKLNESITYQGCVDPVKSTTVLKNYFCLLFPTRFFTEGIPGTIIDAYASGLPVVSSKWKNFNDVIDDGVTGIGYEFDNEAALYEVLMRIVNNPKQIEEMREACCKKAECFHEDYALQLILKALN